MKRFSPALCVLLFWSCTRGQPTALVAESSAKHERVEWSPAQASDAAAAYLLRHLDDKGRFDYLRRSRASDEDYNLLRHAGAIYSLLQYHAGQPTPQVEAGILRASRYLKSRYIRPVKGHAELLAAFSRADEEGVPPGTAKLGGAGLALIALCGSHQLDPNSVSLSELQALGRFLLFMQREDGSFHSKYFESSGYDPEFRSLYYPGEAMLALSKLYGIDQDPRWLVAGLRTAAQLVSSREGVSRPPADHWMMLAGSPLLALYEKVESPPITAEAFREHLGVLGRMMMADQKRRRKHAASSEMGGFDRKARSTPSATRLEGMSSLLRIQRSAKQVDEGLEKSIQDGVAFLQRCQIKDEGPEHGGMPRSCAHDAGAGRRDREIRIDYVQHYLSALLAAEELGLL